MQEIFYEESAEIQNRKSASAKYNIFKTLSIFSYVLMALWFIIVFVAYNFAGNIIIHLIIVLTPFILFFLTGFFLGRMKNKFYIDYDYTFVSGSVRIAKIIKNIKRRLLLTFETRDIEKLGKYGSDTFLKYDKTPGITKLILTSNYTPADGKDFYYLVINNNATKKLLILECTETFMVNILRFSSKSIVEEDYK